MYSKFLFCFIACSLVFVTQAFSQQDFLQASNGTEVSKVSLFWSLPSLTPGATELKIHRSLQPVSCSAVLQSGVLPSATSFEDTFSVVPGRAYYYSIEAFASGQSLGCSQFDSGYARVSPPISVSATDGTYPDKVLVTWQAPPLGGIITGYNLYRGSACGSIIASNLSNTLSFEDFTAVPGVVYQYSLRTLSPTGMSDCSAVDPGFAQTICTNGIDDDGDGLADYPSDPGCTSPSDNNEKESGHICDDGLDNDNDGKIDFQVSGQGDPGCDSPNGNSELNGEAAISSPAFAKFNTYLGQWNFAEIVNQGTTGKVVGITIYNLRGQVMIERSVFVPAGNQVDVDVNALLQFSCTVLNSDCQGFEDRSYTVGAPNGLGVPDGIVDTYGLVRFDWDDSNANERIFGRISFYRPNIDGSFSFAFAREFRNRLTGSSYAMTNTYDPEGGKDLTPNWVEVINFGSRGPQGVNVFDDQTYQVKIYRQDGTLIESRSVSLPPLGEYDVQGGHEYQDGLGRILQGVYLVEVVPNNPDAQYFLSAARYSSNAFGAVDPETYNFAMVLDGRAGGTEAIYAPASNTVSGVTGLAIPPTVDNWIEVGCASSESCTVTAKFKSQLGNLVGSSTQTIPGHGQFHFNASAILPTKETGSVELSSDKPIIAQSMTYVHSAQGKLLSGFASIAKPQQRAKQIGTMNTFLGMQNQLSLVSTALSASSAEFHIESFGGDISSGTINLAAGAGSALSISNNPAINFPADRYGTITLETSSEGQIVGEVRRVRLFGGNIDFVMPTAIR